MLQQELDVVNRGGILAFVKFDHIGFTVHWCLIWSDEMGLGKTIQMIALMVANPPNSEHQVNKPQVQAEEEEVEEIVANSKGKSKVLATAKKMGYGKTTLIVAPASLLHQVRTRMKHNLDHHWGYCQWREEIETKCQDGLLRIHIHHGKYKLKTVKELRAFDVCTRCPVVHRVSSMCFPGDLSILSNTHGRFSYQTWQVRSE